MILITMREWFGQTQEGRTLAIERGHKLTESETRLRGFVTALPLDKALRRIRAYERAYIDRYRLLALEFELVSMATIEHMSDEAIELARVVHVEKLQQRPEDF